MTFFHPTAVTAMAMVCLASSCAASQAAPAETEKPMRSTRCWSGQLTKIDKSGYEMQSVPMLLRVQRDPSTRRMTRELVLGDPATVVRDVFYIDQQGAISFVESDMQSTGYAATGEVESDPWSDDALRLELRLPDQSIRIREWSKGDILYGHYRYRNATGEYGDERFHALTQLDGAECNVRIEQAATGNISPILELPDFVESAATTPQQVNLRFDWPSNMDATIRARIIRTGTQGTAPSVVDATYQLRTTPQRDGLRVLTRSRELLAMPTHTLDDEDRWERATVLASMFPAVLIDDAGAVAELAEKADYLETVRAAFLERWGDGEDTEDEEVLAYVDNNLSAELAKVSAQRYWNPLVAFWAGATMNVGEVRTVDLTRALYVPGALKPVVIQVPTKYGFEGWVPCRAGETEARCVKLFSEYAIGEHDVRRELADAGADGKPIRVMRHSDVTRSVLVADPKTLLPYHYFEIRQLDSVMGNAYERAEIQRREVMDLEFDY